MLAAFHRARVAGLAAVDVGDAGRVDRHRADDRVVLVALAQAHRRHHHHPVRVDAAGLVRLGAADTHAVLGAPGDVHEQVGVGLLVRRLAAVALDVGHRAADHEVLALHVGEEALQPRVVRRAVLLVDLERHRVQRVEGVHAHAALKAGAGELAEAALHLVLRDQVVDAGAHVQEAVDALAGERRNHARQLGVLHRQVVGAATALIDGRIIG